jgi:DNA repair protein RadA/Sms
VALVPKANLPKKSDPAMTQALQGMTVHAVERIDEALEVVRGF